MFNKLLIYVLASFLICESNSLEAAATSQTMIENVVLENQAQLYHSQDRKQLGQSIKNSILQAHESILIFTFSLSDPEIIAALNQQVLAGLTVTVVIDKDHLTEIKSQGLASIEVLTRTSGEGHLHHKILVVDGREIWIGSANFTTSAYKTQENLMVRFFSDRLGEYLQKEANVFRGSAVRTAQGPLLISLLDQDIYFCLLPHEGFPPRNVEKMTNALSKEFLLEKITQATSSLKIAMMVWTNNDLTNAVIQAHRRGVKVQIVVPDLTGNIPKLISAGIEVQVNPKLGLMHNKFMWVDETILVNGSANWSQSSFTRSDESFIVMDPLMPDQLEILKSYWNYLFP